jgi:membrane-associated phospholipid phosphatase
VTRHPWSGATLLPADRVHAAYNLLLAALWAACATRSSVAIPLGVVHLLAASLPVLLRRAPPQLTPGVAVLREYYPLLWLESYWIELDPLIRLLHDRSHDAAILRLETALTGRLWNPELIVGTPSSLLNETMYFLYASYLPLLILPPIVLGMVGRTDIVRDLAFRVSVVAVICFTIYLAWPVAGPAFGPGGLSPVTGAFSHGMRLIRSVGDSEGTAFPSSHVAISVTIALVGWRWLPRRIALALTAWVGAIAVTCVFTGNHYVVDVVAGALLAVMLQPLAHRSRLVNSSVAASSDVTPFPKGS